MAGNSTDGIGPDINNQAAWQTATGNRWGAATVPNTPGADTAGGNVDTSGFLTGPTLSCSQYIYLPLVLLNHP